MINHAYLRLRPHRHHHACAEALRATYACCFTVLCLKIWQHSCSTPRCCMQASWIHGACIVMRVSLLALCQKTKMTTSELEVLSPSSQHKLTTCCFNARVCSPLYCTGGFGRHAQRPTISGPASPAGMPPLRHMALVAAAGSGSHSPGQAAQFLQRRLRQRSIHGGGLCCLAQGPWEYNCMQL